MIQGIIYCATSPSGKKYYGYSSLGFEERKIKHKYSFSKGRNCSFYSAIKKYGWDNISWNIVEKHIANDKKELHKILCERETYWINKDKTNLPEYGYNMTKGGDGGLGVILSEEAKKNISLSKIGNTNNNGKRRAKGRTTYRKGLSHKDELIKKYGEEEGIKRAQNWVQRMAEAKKEKSLSESHKLNIGKSRKGHEVTQETRDKIHQAWERGAFKNRKIKTTK